MVSGFQSSPVLKTSAASKNVDDVFAGESAIGVGDLVYQSKITPSLLLKAENNTDLPVIGMCVRRVDSSNIVVRLLGKVMTTETLEIGKIVFVSSFGKPITSVPLSSGIQRIGIALTENTFLISPSVDLTWRV